MRNLLLASTLLAGIALAGSRSIVTTGLEPDLIAPPTNGDAGVSLSNAQYCRITAYVLDGGNIINAYMPLWYGDPNTVGWMPSSSPACLANQLLPDGGAPSAQFCDLQVAGEFGWLGAQWADGGMQDGGPVSPQVRIDCWGPNLPGGFGGAHN